MTQSASIWRTSPSACTGLRFAAGFRWSWEPLWAVPPGVTSQGPGWRHIAVDLVRKGARPPGARCCARLSSGIGRHRAAGARLRSLVERQMKFSCES
jgi:hypothetical protein